MVAVSNALLYPVFAFLIGGLILTIVPEKYRPTIVIKNVTFITAVFAIIVLTAVPVFSVILNISDIFNLGFFEAARQVLFTFNIGQVWLEALVISGILIIVLLNIKKGKILHYVSLLLALLLIFSISGASHSASLEPILGYFTHSIHFISVSVWGGILLAISISAKDERNWGSFLKWYTPTAILCVVVLTVSGLFLMKNIVPDYPNSFMLTYGQLLLIKHILFFLVIIYGAINGILIRRKVKQDPSFNPKKWLRLESIFLLFTFMATAFMTEKAPPYNVSVTLERVEPSPLFEAIHGSVGPYSSVIMNSSLLGFVFGTVALLSIGLLIRSIMKKKKLYTSFISSLVFILASYVFIMSLVTVESTFETENHQFATIEEAIMAGHSEDDQLTIFQIGNRYEQIIYVLYSINQSQLIAELLYVSEVGYERIFESRLTIGGIPIIDTEHKIRTFLITDGPWQQQGQTFTYVTFGFIQVPADVFSVEIQYEGEHRNVTVENQTFFNISSSNEQWDAIHPIIFYNETNDEIGGYMRHFMETDAFCH